MTNLTRGLGTKVLLTCCVAFLYAPLIIPFTMAFDSKGPESPFSSVWSNTRVVDAAYNSVLLALIVAIITLPLAVLAAMAVRSSRSRRLLVLVMLMPLFVPAVSIGFGETLYFRMLGVSPSMLTMALVQVTWTLPFAFLIVLATMSRVGRDYVDAAYVHGANPIRAFIDVDLPLTRAGVIGSGTFAAVLSLNETIRMSLVQGAFDTLQTYIWGTYLTIGLSPELYALMSMLIVVTLVALAACVVIALVRVLKRKRAIGSRLRGTEIGGASSA